MKKPHRRPCPDMRQFREQVWAYIEPKFIVSASGCWEWQGDRNSLGYAMGCFKGRGWTMTRLMYCATQGSFDPKLDLCHTCDNTCCISPIHLWLGTAKENSLDSKRKKRHYTSAKTHCIRGHAYADHAAIVSGKRVCKECDRLRRELYKTRPPRPNNKIKTHCIRGHAFAGDNLYIKPNGERQCRACRYAVILRIQKERRLHQPP